MFVKNTAGKPSASFTFVLIGFIVVTLWLVLSIAESLGPIHIRPFSGAEAMAYLSPLFALYFGRRQQELWATNGATNGSTPPPSAPPTT